MVLLVDRGALDLQEEALVGPVEQLERLDVIAERLGSFAGRWPVSHVWAGVPAPSVACGPFHSVVMLLALKSPSSGLEPSAAASAVASSTTS